MSPAPILDAVDGFRGAIIDLDRSLVVTPASFSNGWQFLSRSMGEHGLAAGDRVIVAVGNGPLFIAAWTAVLARGGTPFPAHMETPPTELTRIAERFGARFIVTDEHAAADLQTCGTNTTTFSRDGWVEVVWAEFDKRLGLDAKPRLSLPGIPLHPTSGTTGRPMVALRPGPCAVAEARHYVETIGIDESDTILAVAPMSHAYAYGMCAILPMLTSAKLLTMRRFSAKKVFDACQEHGVTVLPAVAAMLDQMMFGAGDRLYDPSRRVITGGAPLTDRTSANFERISGTRVRPLYGTTETGAIAIAREDDPPAAKGRVGQPFDGVSIEIRPTDDPSEFGEALGLVHVRSASVMAGYLRHETIDTSVLNDGWFNTGDLGWIDDNGALHLRGRHAEVINVSGMKVLPSEVAEVIATLPEVAEVHVYPGRNRSGSYFVKSAVVAHDKIDRSRIKAHCEKHLVYYKRPSQIIMVDSLPRSSRGKIIREQLP